MKTFSVFEVLLSNKGHGRLQLPALSVCQSETALLLTIIQSQWVWILKGQSSPLLNWRETVWISSNSCHITWELVKYKGQVGKSLLDSLRSWLTVTVCLHLMQCTWLTGLRHSHTRDEATLIPLIREAFVLSHFAARGNKSCRVRLLPFAIDEHSELLTPIALLWSLHSGLSWRVTGQFILLCSMQELAKHNLLPVKSSGFH